MRTLEHSPVAIFDSLLYFKSNNLYLNLSDLYRVNDIEFAIKFLSQYTESSQLFNLFRSGLEKLIHWSALISKKSILEMTVADIENFLIFCVSPPESWVCNNPFSGL